MAEDPPTASLRSRFPKHQILQSQKSIQYYFAKPKFQHHATSYQCRSTTEQERVINATAPSTFTTTASSYFFTTFEDRISCSLLASPSVYTLQASADHLHLSLSSPAYQRSKTETHISSINSTQPESLHLSQLSQLSPTYSSPHIQLTSLSPFHISGYEIIQPDQLFPCIETLASPSFPDLSSFDLSSFDLSSFLSVLVLLPTAYCRLRICTYNGYVPFYPSRFGPLFSVSLILFALLRGQPQVWWVPFYWYVSWCLRANKLSFFPLFFALCSIDLCTIILCKKRKTSDLSTLQ